MPAYAFLNTPLRCPSCGSQLDDQAWFQWGFCIDRAQRPETTYSVGDSIRWQRSAEGATPSWTYFYRAGNCLGGNFGDPNETDVVVCDWANTQHQGPCPSCGTQLGSTAVEIRAGRIVRGWITRAGELPTGAVVCRRRSDGTLEALLAGDRPMSFLYEQ